MPVGVPSLLHQALVALFENRLALAPELLRDALGVPMPEWESIRRESVDLSQLTPTEYRADLVIVLDGRGSQLAVIIEVQLRPDEAKKTSWPVYITTLRARLRCPVVLLVVAPTPPVAQWAVAPIELGHPGFTLVPLVASFASIPVVTSAEDARASPELAVLSALAHGKGEPERAAAIAAAALGVARALDDERTRVYVDLVYGALDEAARIALEALMFAGKYEYQSDFARKYYGEGVATGEAKGRAEALLVLLAARGLAPSPDERQRIVAERDLSRLDAWIERAVTVASVGEMFGADAGS